MSLSQRGLKKKVLALLAQADIDRIIAELKSLPPAKLLNPLFSGICNSDETMRWHAVTAMGVVVAGLADQDMEAARVVMRRFMWSLNDESGGIGWGAPEAMAECLAAHEGLALEYTHILVSFMRPDGFFLEHPPLQRGLMWALGRLAVARPQLLRGKDAVRYLLGYLDSDDAVIRGLAAWALGNLKAREAAAPIRKLLNNPVEFRFYHDRRLKVTTVGDLARRALDALGC